MPLNPWLAFVKQYHQQHPELEYKEALRQAGKIYKKQGAPSVKLNIDKDDVDIQIGDGVVKDVIQKGIKTVAKIAGVNAQAISSMTDDERMFAEIANASYLTPEERPAEIWGYSYIPNLSDDKHATYARGDTAKFSVRGTKVTDVEDIANDKVIAEGGDLTKSARFKRAEKLLKKVMDKYKKVTLVAHSLGGRLIQLLSKKYNVIGYTFNAGSSIFQKKENLPKVTNLRIIGDPISTSPMGGKTKWFNVEGTLNKHSLNNFLIGPRKTQEEREEVLRSVQEILPEEVKNIIIKGGANQSVCTCVRCPTCGQRI